MFYQPPRPPTLASGSVHIRLAVPFLFSCLCAFEFPPLAYAQEAVVAEEENLRAEPNGAILGRLAPGTRVSPADRDGDWIQIEVRGFVFVPSLHVRSDGPLDLVVSAPGGENLREEPSGRISGRLESGTLLEEVSRIPGWIEVRRVGWMWAASLNVDADEGRNAILDSPSPLAEFPSPPPDPADPASGETTTDRFRAGAADATVVKSDVSVSDIVGDPSAYEGQLVELDLQFISVERAERLRSDFYEGEPFLLMRSAEGSGFVYLTVAPERISEMEAIPPLQGLRIVGRVRSAAAAFTGNPILELLEIESLP